MVVIAYLLTLVLQISEANQEAITARTMILLHTIRMTVLQVMSPLSTTPLLTFHLLAAMIMTTRHWILDFWTMMPLLSKTLTKRL